MSIVTLYKPYTNTFDLNLTIVLYNKSFTRQGLIFFKDTLPLKPY